EISDRSARRAGLDYWQYLDLEMHENLDAFLAKYGEADLFFVETGADTVYSDITFPDNPFLLFGKETLGLPKELLTGERGTVLTIPVLPHIRSLNLSNAVAVVAYEVLRQKDFSLG
ncbi:MAG: tRNA (uridine(34)/cytosine(34)/5-carboxymethylaminomethyluridine(34)-2'-O)-methyltransferase TrmL, partial [Oscillospiraceae bacterium]|nr:tRNA (uridine(34)/cytosine(34)/5-carboxymethylaminomethyluridine(34)-2'-O)-methyltransferase TrmL [Oscillospiraceae bacterium]